MNALCVVCGAFIPAIIIVADVVVVVVTDSHTSMVVYLLESFSVSKHMASTLAKASKGVIMVN